MNGYLIGEEGSLLGQVFRFEGGTEWTIGRDPDEVGIVLEDPMVSRKHVICRLSAEGFVLENLSAVNPATQNGKIINEPVLLKEGDIIQIGNTFFRFSEKSALSEQTLSPVIENSYDLNTLSVSTSSEARWMVKVVSGPNLGAEFYMHRKQTYIIGKDSSLCDIILQDLSVSRQHARISVDENDQIYIEDLGSRNGTFVNSNVIQDRYPLKAEDTVTLGTTHFLIVDRENIQQTVIAEAPVVTAKTSSEEEIQTSKGWRDLVIPRKHLMLGGIIGLSIFGLCIGMVSLFHSKPVIISNRHENEKLAEILKKYPSIQYSYHEGSGKLFITGHVITAVEKQEVLYQLNGLPFLKGIEDTIVIGNYVADNMNALIMTNSAWQGISIYSPEPGKFVVRGYLQTSEQGQSLTDYLYLNFPYIDRLDNQVVLESNLITQIQSVLLDKGFNNVAYQITEGDLVFSGRIDGKDKLKFDEIVQSFKSIPGIRSVRNYVVLTTADSSLVDISDKYQIMGYSKKDGENLFIVINGKILTLGDHLDGMTLKQISPNVVMLEKDGLKFKINYNLQ